MHPIVKEDLESILADPLDWARFQGKRVLVTGAAGFLPAYMVETLLMLKKKHGIACEVIGLVRNLEKAKTRFQHWLDTPELSFVVADVSEGIPVDTRCDFIIHAASQASPKYYGVDPVGTMTANVLGAYHLLHHAQEWGSEGFLLFSSGDVYGQVPADRLSIDESGYGYIDILNFRACYGESKRAAETMLVSFLKQFGVPGVIVRPSHTYGPGMSLDDGRVFADFVRDIVNRHNITLYSDGSAVRPFCYLSDAVAGYFTVLLKGDPGQAYNVSNPNAVLSIRALAELLVSMYPELGLKVEYQTRSDGNYIPSPVAFGTPSIDRLAQLGWNPHYSPREGFERTISYYENISEGNIE
jgi:nucleoside-diphosphate-sugar epimerase